MDRVTVRPAEVGDLDGLLGLAAARREQYERYQPQFWRPAADAVDRQRRFFGGLLGDGEVAVLVAADDGPVRGFVIARVVDAPPVYDPGGRTCLVDDVIVEDDADWPVLGPPLLAAVAAWSASRGARQVVVVTAHLDEAKRSALAAVGLSLASEWWVGPIAPVPSGAWSAGPAASAPPSHPR